MDDTIVDLNGRVFSLLGKTFKDFNNRKDCWAALGDKKLNLYKDLEPLPDAKLLIDKVLELANIYNYTVSILTAIPRDGSVPLAEKHKKEWVDLYFHHIRANFKIGPFAVDKQNHCNAGDILIDDNALNISQWNTKGGFGILHIDAISSILKLSNYLKGLYC